MFARLSSRIGGVAAVSLRRTAVTAARSNTVIAASSSSASSLTAASPSFSATASFLHTSARAAAAESYVFDPPDSNQPVQVTFIDLNNARQTVTGYVNESLLDVSNRLDIGIDGACGGGSAPVAQFGDGAMCSFCHVRIPSGWHDKLPDADHKEIQNLNDCRPPADGLSRLACQIRLRPEHDGMTVALTVNLQPNNYINEMVLHPEEQLKRNVQKDEVEDHPEFFAELSEHRDREKNVHNRMIKFDAESPERFD